VADARAAAKLFAELGFEEAAAPLLDERATAAAIHELVTDTLKHLGPGDSLVLFYAGHGGTRLHDLGSRIVKTGYLIPIDASDSAATWIDLKSWLHAVALLPARHILVLLDACHSGIALDPVIKWRGAGDAPDRPSAALRARRSRRIITSALDDQLALDSGPVHGHSLFTGCLIQGLTSDLAQPGRYAITGSELALYLQRRVSSYPDSRQTPDFGAFDFDDRGELEIPLAAELWEDPTLEDTRLPEPPLPPQLPIAAPAPAAPAVAPPDRDPAASDTLVSRSESSPTLTKWEYPTDDSAPEKSVVRPRLSTTQRLVRPRARSRPRSVPRLFLLLGAALACTLALLAYHLLG
jgi:uncharacterized caspase-like protein